MRTVHFSSNITPSPQTMTAASLAEWWTEPGSAEQRPRVQVSSRQSLEPSRSPPVRLQADVWPCPALEGGLKLVSGLGVAPVLPAPRLAPRLAPRRGRMPSVCIRRRWSPLAHSGTYLGTQPSCCTALSEGLAIDMSHTRCHSTAGELLQSSDQGSSLRLEYIRLDEILWQQTAPCHLQAG